MGNLFSNFIQGAENKASEGMKLISQFLPVGDNKQASQPNLIQKFVNTANPITRTTGVPLNQAFKTAQSVAAQVPKQFQNFSQGFTDPYNSNRYPIGITVDPKTGNATRNKNAPNEPFAYAAGQFFGHDPFAANNVFAPAEKVAGNVTEGAVQKLAPQAPKYVAPIAKSVAETGTFAGGTSAVQKAAGQKVTPLSNIALGAVSHFPANGLLGAANDAKNLINPKGAMHPEDVSYVDRAVDALKGGGLNPQQKATVVDILDKLGSHYLKNTDIQQISQKSTSNDEFYMNIAKQLQKVAGDSGRSGGAQIPGLGLVDNNSTAPAQSVVSSLLGKGTGGIEGPSGQPGVTANTGTAALGTSPATIAPQSLPPSSMQTAENLGKASSNQPPVSTVPQGEKERQFVTSVKESGQSPQGLKDLVSGTYNVKKNTDLIAAAQQRVLQDPVKAYHFATEGNNDESTATAVELVKQLSQQGKHDIAATIVNKKAQQLTEAGRTVQAASLYDSLSPAGVGQLAAKTIQQYNEGRSGGLLSKKIPDLTGDQLKKFSDQAANIQQLPAGSREQNMARQKMLQDIQHLVPSSAGSKALALWRAGLLTGPQTVTKIGVSHAAMSALEQVKNIPTAMADKTMSLITGRRSMSLTGQGLASGGKQGIKDAVDYFVHNYEAPNSGGFNKDFKNGVNFGDSLPGKVAQQYVDTIGRLHGSLYKPFFGAAHMNSLYDQALTEAGNKGLKGAGKQNFVLGFVKNPTPEAAKVAQRDAEQATFQQPTALGKAAGAVQKSFGGAGNLIAPFTRIPSAILTDVIDYSPVGTVKSVIQAVNRGEFTQDSQRQLSQGLGRSVTGTGILATGAALYNKGMIALDRPQDPKQAAQWDAEGRKPQSILIGGQWRNLGSLGPLGHALAIGGYFQQGLAQNGLGGAIQTVAAGAGKTTLDQSYLQGVSGAISALQDPSRYAQSFTQNMASSVVPTGSATIARAIDPQQRQVNGVTDAIKNKVPGLRQTLLPKSDVFGTTTQRSGGIAQNLIDPFTSSTDTSGNTTNNPVMQELGRLNNAGFNATPAKIGTKITIGKEKITLTPTQSDKLNKLIGPPLNSSLQALVQSPEYASLSDDDKQNAVKQVERAVKKQVIDGLSQQ